MATTKKITSTKKPTTRTAATKKVASNKVENTAKKTVTKELENTAEEVVLEEEITKEVDVVNDTFTLYISGIDTFGNITTVSRSDVNMVITVNPNTNQVLITSIPRDYYVQLKDTTGYTSFN